MVVDQLLVMVVGVEGCGQIVEGLLFTVFDSLSKKWICYQD